MLSGTYASASLAMLYAARQDELHRALTTYLSREYFPQSVDDVCSFFSDFKHGEVTDVLDIMTSDGEVTKEFHPVRKVDVYSPIRT